MNDEFVNLEKLPSHLKFCESYYDEPDGDYFCKKHKKSLDKYNISQDDLIYRQYNSNHKRILKFKKNFLKNKIFNEEALELFCECTLFKGHPCSEGIRDILNLFSILCDEGNVEYFKKLICGTFSDGRPNECLIGLISCYDYFCYSFVFKEDYSKDYSSLTPYNFGGIVGFLLYRKNPALLNRTIKVILKIAEAVPEESFVLIYLLSEYVAGFFHSYYTRHRFYERMRQSKKIMDFMNKIKPLKLSDIKIYGTGLNPIRNYCFNKISNLWLFSW